MCNLRLPRNSWLHKTRSLARIIERIQPVYRERKEGLFFERMQWNLNARLVLGLECLAPIRYRLLA